MKSEILVSIDSITNNAKLQLLVQIYGISGEEEISRMREKTPLRLA